MMVVQERHERLLAAHEERGRTVAPSSVASAEIEGDRADVLERIGAVASSYRSEVSREQVYLMTGHLSSSWAGPDPLGRPNGRHPPLGEAVGGLDRRGCPRHRR